MQADGLPAMLSAMTARIPLQPLFPAIGSGRLAVASLAAGLAFLLLADAARPDTKVAEKPAPAESFAGPLAETEKSLAEVRTRLRAIPEAGETVPAGVDAAAAGEKRVLLSGLVFNLEALARTYQERRAIGLSMADALQRETRWDGFTEPPPYPVLLVDDLESASEAARNRIEELRAVVGAAEAQFDVARDKARQAEQDERRAAEAVDAAKDDTAKAAARWQLGLASLRRETALSALRLQDERLGAARDRLTQAGAEARLAQRQYEAAEGQVRFAREDLDAVLKASASRRAELDKDVAAARKRRQEFNDDDLAKLRARTDALRAAASPDLPAAEARLRAAETRADADRATLDVLESLAGFHRLIDQLWQDRFRALNDPDPGRRVDAQARIKEVQGRLHSWSVWAGSELRVGQEAQRQQERRLEAARGNAELAAMEEAALDAVERRSAALARCQRTVDDGARLADRWLGHLAAKRARRPFAEAAGEAVASGWSKVKGVWGQEVFTVNDTVKIDGRDTTIPRAITVGKILTSAVFLIAGFLLTRHLARRIERFAMRRSSMTPAHARTARRTFEGVAWLVIALITLHLVRIPLTAFAFLGGALAIGVGFGTQTLIKNLISGLIVFGERKVRLGDIIEIDNVVGTVTAIDTRSCTVQAFDGTESLIPNSFLLENRVNNWTYSSRNVRRSVRVGVAYGSPARQVADILEACARRHGLVLAEPKPLVIFEDFGDNAMVFVLYFWVPLKADVNAAQVASDLRFLIGKGFAEAGIAIACPQRDVRLVADQLLTVRVANQPPQP